MRSQRLHLRWKLGATGVVVLLMGVTTMTSCATARLSARAARAAAVKSSPNFVDGRFVNTLPRQDAPMLEMLGKWIAGVEHSFPREAIPVVVQRPENLVTAPRSGLRITWLGHSSQLIEIDGHRVLVDPVWSPRVGPASVLGPKRFHPPPLAMESIGEIDAVVISHDHFDHLDKRTIVALNGRELTFVVPLGVGAHLDHWGVPPERIIERDWWGSVELGTLTLTATPARHFSGRSVVMADRDETLWAGWVIAGPEHRVFFSGDTAMFPGFAEIGERLGPFDATMFEVGAYNQMWADVHIGPEQAIRAHQLLGGGVLVPVHWGTFDLGLHGWTEPIERIVAAAEAAGVTLVTPRPGESIEPDAPPAVARWWPEVPWRTAEQAPVVSSGLAPASSDTAPTQTHDGSAAPLASQPTIGVSGSL